jgi:gluconolactonase
VAAWRWLRAAQRPGVLAGRALLYIADTGATHKADGPRHIRRFRVQDDGAQPLGGEVFAECGNGLFDGLRVDTHGNIWTSAGDGVHCYTPDGA